MAVIEFSVKTTTAGDLEEIKVPIATVDGLQDELDKSSAHIANTSNPHGVTKAQVGLGNVDNTSDSAKPISTATQTALNAKANSADLAKVATSGSYTDLSNKPTIPTVNNGTLTVTQNGTSKGTFTANQSTNTTIALTDTTYTFASGDNNGTIKVTPSGGEAQNVAVEGLGSAAYTASTAYATSAQGTKADNAVPNTRKVNGKALSADITLSASDVGALSSSTAYVSSVNGSSGAITNVAKTNASNTFSGNQSVTGNLTVGGNLVVNGTNTTVNSTTLAVKDKLIEVASGNTVALTTPAGLVAPKYDGTNSGALVFDASGTAYVGDVVLDSSGNITVASSALQPLATRSAESDLTNGNLLKWDGTNKTLVDSGLATSTVATKSEVNAKQDKLTAGTNITISGSTISAKDTTYSVATQSANGLMSSTDKTKLDGIASGANKITVDTAMSSTSTNPVQNKVVNTAISAKYTKPSGGIPKSDLASDVQTSLGKADSALQSHQDISGKLDLSGGTMTGQLKWSNGTALPENNSPKYFVTIDAFAEGGATKWASLANTKTALGVPSTYAGSSSAGGSATSAVKLDTATAGSATQPVYFSGGKPVATTYTLGASVPSGAKFTDTDTGATSVTTSGSGNAVTTASYDASTRKLTLTKGTTFLTSHQDISGKVNRSGDTFTGLVKFNEVDGSCINFENGIYINKQGGSTLLGTNGSTAWVGMPAAALTLRGSATRPTYQGKDLALYSDIPTNYVTTDTSQYGIIGEKEFEGDVNFNSNVYINKSIWTSGSAGTSGQVLTSQGAEVSPKWTTPTSPLNTSTTIDATTLDAGVYYWSLSSGTYTAKWLNGTSNVSKNFNVPLACTAKVTVYNKYRMHIDVTLQRDNSMGGICKMCLYCTGSYMYGNTTYHNWVQWYQGEEGATVINTDEWGYLDIATGYTKTVDAEAGSYTVTVARNGSTSILSQKIYAVSNLPFHCTINKPCNGGITCTHFNETGVTTAGYNYGSSDSIEINIKETSGDSSVYVYLTINGSVSGYY